MGAEMDHSDSHVHPKLRKQVRDLCTTVEWCLAQNPRLPIPALILVYSGIDGMAWLTMPDGHEDVRGADFQAWVKEYLLPDAGLACDEADLWAARCGLVHAQIMDSQSARHDRARHIWYHVGPGNQLLIPIHEVSRELPVTISVETFVAAFRSATERFFERIEQDGGLERRVSARASRYFDEVKAR
jgi:hypothetical protein